MFNEIYINLLLYINSLTPKKIFILINNSKKMGSNKNKPEIYLNKTLYKLNVRILTKDHE